MLVSGGVFVYGTNQTSRAIRRAGIRISRVRGILGAIFYTLPYTQIIGLILAARQARINRYAIERLEGASSELRPTFY